MAQHRQAVSSLTCACSFEGEYVEGQMNGLGVYRWSNGRHETRAVAHVRSPSLARLSIFKGQGKENNMHGCGKKWYPGGALEEVRGSCSRAGNPR